MAANRRRGLTRAIRSSAARRAGSARRQAAGSRRRAGCPRPAGSRRSSRPPSASTRSASPRRPEPRRGVGAADAVVGDRDGEPVAGAVAHVDRHAATRRVLGDVGQRLRAHEVGGRLDRGRAARPASTRSSTGTVRGAPAPAAPRRARPRSAPPGGCRARARASSARAASSWRSTSARSSRGAALADAGRERLDVGRHRGEPPLGALAELALQPASLRVGRLDDPAARGGELLDARAHLGLQAHVVTRHPRRRGDRLDSSGSSSTARSWTSTATRSPSVSTGVTARSAAGRGSSNGRPASSM